MKKFIALACVLVMIAATFCSCSGNCERCGESALTLNQVGDDVNGIHVCDTCIEKMRMGKINFNFVCGKCNEEILGKQNIIIVDGLTQYVCNSCMQ